MPSVGVLMLIREKSVEIQVRAAGVPLHMAHFIVEVISCLCTVSEYVWSLDCFDNTKNILSILPWP